MGIDVDVNSDHVPEPSRWKGNSGFRSSIVASVAGVLMIAALGACGSDDASDSDAPSAATEPADGTEPAENEPVEGTAPDEPADPPPSDSQPEPEPVPPAEDQDDPGPPAGAPVDITVCERIDPSPISAILGTTAGPVITAERGDTAFDCAWQGQGDDDPDFVQASFDGEPTLYANLEMFARDPVGPAELGAFVNQNADGVIMRLAEPWTVQVRCACKLVDDPSNDQLVAVLQAVQVAAAS